MKDIETNELDVAVLWEGEASSAKSVSISTPFDWMLLHRALYLCFVCQLSTAVEIRFPRFRGTSYLALPTLRDAHRSMQINIEFRPEHYNGVLLYSGEQQTLEGDFIALIINQGFAEFRSQSIAIIAINNIILNCIYGFASPQTLFALNALILFCSIC